MHPLNYLLPLLASTALALPESAGPVTTVTTTLKCDYKYCDEEGTSWCFHFVPFTTVDPTLGPLPGETRTSIGLCGSKATNPAVNQY